MGVIRRQAISNSIISYLGIILGYLNIAVLFPRLLGDELFGFTQVIIAAMMLFANFGSLGIRNVTLRYFPIFRIEFNEKRNPFQSLLLIAMLTGSLLSIICLLLFEEQVVKFYLERAHLIAQYVEVLYFLIPVGILGYALDSYSQSLHRTTETAFAKEILVRILNLLSVLLFYFGYVAEAEFIWIFSGVQGVYAILLILFLVRVQPFSFHWNLKAITKPKLIDISKYAGISLFSSTIAMSGNIQMLLVGTIAGLQSAAIFGVAAAIGKVLNVTGRSVNRIAGAVVSDAWANNDLGRIRRIYAKSAKTNLVIAGMLFTLIVVNLESIFFILPEGYNTGEQVLLLLMVAKVINLSTGMNAGIIQQSKRYRMNLLFNGITLFLTLGLNLWLIPEMGITGVGIADLTTVSVVNALRFFYLKQSFNMQPFDWSTLWISMLISLFSLVGYHVAPFMEWFIDIPLRLLFFGFLYTSIIYTSKWSSDFNESLDLALKKARSFF